MADLSLLAGSQTQSINVYIKNTSGAGLTGLAFNTSGLICYYTYAGNVTTATVVSLVTLAAVTTAYTSGGFKEIDATHMPGMYRFDIPNAALQINKGPQVTLYFSGASSMAQTPFTIQIITPHTANTAYGNIKYIY